MDTLQNTEVIVKDTPKTLTDYYKQDITGKDVHLESFIEEHFPTLRAEIRHETARNRRLGVNPVVKTGEAQSAIIEPTVPKKTRGRSRKDVDGKTEDRETPEAQVKTKK